jgi:hypothetical protein
MWWTPSGERALKGAEWELFRLGLDLSWDLVEASQLDQESDAFGVKAFDRLQPSQRLALLAQVGSALKDESLPHPELTAHTEAAVAVIFGQIAALVAMEIDLTSEEDPLDRRTSTRKLVLAAYREIEEQDAATERNAPHQPVETRSCESPMTVREDDDDDDDCLLRPPAVDSNDHAEWECLVDYLANRILWEDRDYEMGDEFMDADPGESRLKMEIMGIADDYYTAIAPDPTEVELVSIRQQLRTLCIQPESENSR